MVSYLLLPLIVGSFKNHSWSFKEAALQQEKMEPSLQALAPPIPSHRPAPSYSVQVFCTLLVCFFIDDPMPMFTICLSSCQSSGKDLSEDSTCPSLS